MKLLTGTVFLGLFALSLLVAAAREAEWDKAAVDKSEPEPILTIKERLDKNLDRANERLSPDKNDTGADTQRIQEEIKKDLDELGNRKNPDGGANAGLHLGVVGGKELARENNVLAADRLIAVKMRQDECVSESERIHRKLQKENQWTRGLRTSIDDNGNTQAGLAKETESLREKLSHAPVFEHILKGTAASMEQAAEAIKQRARAGKVGFPLDKDDLADENKRQEKIVGLQNDAGKRLGWLIDTLKDDAVKKPTPAPNKKPEKKAGDDSKKADEPMKKQKAKTQRDGIPVNAEFKLLGRLQDQVLQRTREFDKRLSDRKLLTDDQLEELRGIERNQREIQRLFDRVRSNLPRKGDDE